MDNKGTTRVVILLLCILAVAAMAAATMRRQRLERFSAQPSSATSRYYTAGLRNFAPGARVDDFMMSLSRGEAVCSAFNDQVRTTNCKNDIHSVTSPAPSSLVPLSCDSFDATTKPLNDTDSNVSVFGRVYKFSKMCLPLSFDTRSGSLVNTDETALALVLSRALFVRPTRSAMYSVTYDDRGRSYDYVWPTAKATLSWSVLGDKAIFDNAVAKSKTLTELLREHSASAATATIPTTVYFLDEIEPSIGAAAAGRVRVVSAEGRVAVTPTYALASAVGDTQMHVKYSAKDAGGITVRIKVGPRVVLEKATGATGLSPTDLRFAWTVLDTAVIYMLYAPGPEARVVFGIVRTHRAMSGVGGTLPPNTYGYIPNFYRVYQRMKEGEVHRAVTALPQRFTLRPASIDPTKCLERRSDGVIVSALCSRGKEDQAWTADDKFVVRQAGAPGKPCMQIPNVGGAAYVSADCTAGELMRFDQVRRQLTWRDGRYCASSADGMLRVRECGTAAAAAGVTAYDVMPFV